MTQNPGYYIYVVLGALIALSLHEFAHGLAAYKLGDPTAKSVGRLSVNPLRHLDPIGALCMVLFHFGWAKPVPINPRNFKKPKRDFALTALAGPAMNLAVAFFTAPIYLLFLKLFYISSAEAPNVLLFNFALFFSIFHTLNVGLAVFNLIPIPPLDGSRLLNALLPSKTYFRLMRYERITYWVLIGWLLLGEYVTAFFLAFPFIRANAVLSAIARIFSLSDLLGEAFGAISKLILSFWKLFPFFKI